MGMAADSAPNTTEPVRREVPDNGLREFLIYELHVFGAVSYPLLGKSQVVQRGRRCRKTPASRQPTADGGGHEDGAATTTSRHNRSI